MAQKRSVRTFCYYYDDTWLLEVGEKKSKFDKSLHVGAVWLGRIGEDMWR